MKYLFLFLLLLALSSECIRAQDDKLIERSLASDDRHEHRLLDGAVVIAQLTASGAFDSTPT